ncbi:rab11 family-interacting protein 1 [Callorhinchus milii]|uniref:Rab11 family-interacting protein 2 n=1 Tax=Callorhinchus milii TaxID=7868 RepID=A0A4W3GXW0_CALMI|nr:rab11 family-interacting protein 1 [Callorhinchus milii]XP_042200388.1 rab11 family-interacting protein 1 [Callorhinchus milii]XP_042200389.1 rab11 family-interacting protein 1 [Callorhinchus milii]
MSLADQNKVWSPTHVKVVVLQARGLRAKGKEATNDAYVIMQLGKEKYSSSVKEKSQEPFWREEAEFELPVVLQGNSDKYTLHLIVMHRALVGLDKFLGQASINLSELSDKRASNKTGWYKLTSKPGKKPKERGEIEADIRFVRNSMTASMFDLSMKDKSRSRFGKLKDKVTGGKKKAGGMSDSASAIVPSLSGGLDSDDDRPEPDTKKKSKLRTLFAKSNLQRTSLSQSMSVLPTSPHTITTGTDTEGHFTEIKLHTSTDEESSGRADKKLHVPKIMTHKRTASADTKQQSFLPGSNAKKEGLGLGLFGGLRGKPDSGSQSNLCINGSHVYSEEPSASLQPKNQAISRSMQNLTGPFSGSVEDLRYPTYRTQGSTENLAPSLASGLLDTGEDGLEPRRPEPPKEDKRGGGLLGLVTGKKAEPASETSAVTKEALGDSGEEETESTRSEVLKVPVDNRKEESKKEEGRKGLFSLVTGKRDTKKLEVPEATEAKEPMAESMEEEEGRKPAGNSIWASRTAASKPKPHPVKPLKAGIWNSKSPEGREGRSGAVDADLSEPEAAYAQLTRAELVQLLLRQKETVVKKDDHIRELEDYIDNLLVRVMETTPSILRTVAPPTKKAERV